MEIRLILKGTFFVLSARVLLCIVKSSCFLLTHLGGDMEHTHLVKGLDFALLQKVRSEIVNRERAAEEDEQLMKEIEKKEADPKT